MEFRTGIAKRALSAIALFFIVWAFCLPSWAITIQDIPNPRQTYGGWVTDMADLLTPKAETQLNQMISDLELRNGREIAVVTVPETTPYPTPKALTTDLFNTWGIGKRDVDNGILFLVSSGDKRIEIETGYGIEAILPDAVVAEIIDKQILPEFKHNDFDAGIIAGTKAIVTKLGGSLNKADQTWKNPLVSILQIFLVIVASIFSLSNSNNSSGGSDFGGGSSGGGGAGGSW
ncbi:MAG: TPM domain-containing protein [Kamptonema sp. SIO1D9]|nr:TPM domain-containing protein [Kamptonema sp. SIO1D9]